MKSKVSKQLNVIVNITCNKVGWIFLQLSVWQRGGGGGQKLSKFAWRHLWMLPNVPNKTKPKHITSTKKGRTVRWKCKYRTINFLWQKPADLFRLWKVVQSSNGQYSSHDSNTGLNLSKSCTKTDVLDSFSHFLPFKFWTEKDLYLNVSNFQVCRIWIYTTK